MVKCIRPQPIGIYASVTVVGEPIDTDDDGDDDDDAEAEFQRLPLMFIMISRQGVFSKCWKSAGISLLFLDNRSWSMINK